MARLEKNLQKKSAVQCYLKGSMIRELCGIQECCGAINGYKKRSCVSLSQQSGLNCWAIAHLSGAHESRPVFLYSNVKWLRTPTSIILPLGIFIPSVLIPRSKIGRVIWRGPVEDTAHYSGLAGWMQLPRNRGIDSLPRIVISNPMGKFHG